MLLLPIMLASLAGAAGPPPAEQATIFGAAGFVRRGKAWKSGECDGAESDSYSPGAIEQYGDINGDGRPEAIVTEGGAICYGNTGAAYWLLTKGPTGRWTLLDQGVGMLRVLRSNAGGWPEIEVGGPGFCFTVLRFNGKAYAVARHAYQGKPCKR